METLEILHEFPELRSPHFDDDQFSEILLSLCYEDNKKHFRSMKKMKDLLSALLKDELIIGFYIHFPSTEVVLSFFLKQPEDYCLFFLYECVLIHYLKVKYKINVKPFPNGYLKRNGKRITAIFEKFQKVIMKDIATRDKEADWSEDFVELINSMEGKSDPAVWKHAWYCVRKHIQNSK